MGSVSGLAQVAPSRISGSFVRDRRNRRPVFYRSEENFRPKLFGAVAKIVWDKPDMVIADIAKVSDRMARDYLNGKAPAPPVVLAALMFELARRD